MSYWITGLGLIAFGVIGMFSIGRPFFLVGAAMLLLAPLRHRPALYWPPLVAVVAYNVGWWAVAPLSCTATQAVGGVSTTVCSSLSGISYTGSGVYNLRSSLPIRPAFGRPPSRSWSCSRPSCGMAGRVELEPQGPDHSSGRTQGR